MRMRAKAHKLTRKQRRAFDAHREKTSNLLFAALIGATLMMGITELAVFVDGRTLLGQVIEMQDKEN